MAACLAAIHQGKIVVCGEKEECIIALVGRTTVECDNNC